MAKLYKQKLVTIEAIQFTGEHQDEITAFCSLCFHDGKGLRMRHAEAGRDAPKEFQSFAMPQGCWIQKNPDGTYSPCSDSFLHYYEPVD